MFRFSIRELMLVTTTVALVIGWWVDRSRLAADEHTWHERAESVRTKMETEHKLELEWNHSLWPENEPLIIKR